jgi:hypothetical protein
VIGAWGDDDNGRQSGSAYVFVRSDGIWSEQAKLLASDGGSGHYFGISVAMSGDTIVIGASNSELAYIFVRSGGSWIEQAKLEASGGEFAPGFGHSVAISGDTAVVGARYDDNKGSAYVFVRNDGIWSEQAKLLASDASTGDLFGQSVAIGGGTIVIGAPTTYDTGSAYAFIRSDGIWSQAGKLTPSNAHSHKIRNLGHSVAISGDIIVTGAPTMYSGSAYVFVRSEGIWSREGMLLPSDGEDGDKFGGSVAISGNTLVVGAFGAFSAYAYVFTPNHAPVADAGQDQAITILGAPVQLDGTQSWDPDGDFLYYVWTIVEKPDGSLASLDDPSSSTPTFVPDLYGSYTFKLYVVDPWFVRSDDDYVTVSCANLPPVADPGGNQFVTVWEPVFLDGSGSSDPNGDLLTYSWRFFSKPTSSSAEINDPTSESPDFTPDVDGTYVVSLVVNDGVLDSDPSYAYIYATYIQDQVKKELDECIDQINDLALGSFMNKKMQNALTNKIFAVLELIDQGLYQEALDKLMHDILAKTNGCQDIGYPDKNDWIRDCDAQDAIYNQLINAINLLEEMV